MKSEKIKYKITEDLYRIIHIIHSSPFDASKEERIDPVLEEGFINASIPLLKKHRLLLPFYSALKRNNIQVTALLKKECSVLIQKHLFLRSELKRLSNHLNEKDIGFIILKGFSLCKFDDTFPLRQFGDLDFFVENRKIPSTVTLLEQVGYQNIKTYKQKRIFRFFYRLIKKDLYLRNSEKGILIELHYRFLPFLDHTVEDRLIVDTSKFHMDGELYRMLNPDANLFYLTIHGTIHMWQRLFWLYDLVNILTKNDEPDFQKIIEYSKQSGYINALVHTFEMLEIIFKIKVPEEIKNTSYNPRTVCILNRISLIVINEEMSEFRYRLLRFRFILKINKKISYKIWFLGGIIMRKLMGVN